MEFFGIQFTSKGMAITEEKLKSLIETEIPTTKSELRSHLELASFCSRALYNLARVSGKLWHLTKKLPSGIGKFRTN